MTWQTLGFEGIKKFFSSGELSAHAYLFHGQDMIGKRTFALEFAHRHADPADIMVVVEHDIEAVRGAKQFLSLSAWSGNKKFVIVDDADKLTDEAQNALLKALEEPSATSVLMLISHRPDALLATIRSRCQALFFPTHTSITVRAFLKDKKLSVAQEDFLCAFSNGSIGLLSRIDDFKSIKTISEEFGAIAKGDINKRFDIAKRLADDGDLEQKILYWMLYLRSTKHYQSLGAMLALYRTISQPQYNRQLALENFMLEL